MKPELSIPRQTRAEKEAEAEANRVIEQIKNALAVVAARSADEDGSLEAAADRIERTARDLAFALRDLAHERSIQRD
ncbi:MAG TPA: hypothetical protein VMM84_01820 [Pyrinomonadaceae bacterium]|nr:hypothetical protein [Pyrinomonadaceae bacterium]